jgi:hypothetical protein
MYRIFHPRAPEYTFFSASSVTFSNINPRTKSKFLNKILLGYINYSR